LALVGLCDNRKSLFKPEKATRNCSFADATIVEEMYNVVQDNG